jgi:hypothetical protein
MSSRKRRKVRKPACARAEAAARNDLKAASRAQLGPDEEKRPYRPMPDDASIEDPLRDWPEDER